MQFETDLERLRVDCAMHGSLRDDEPDWPAIAQSSRLIAAQIPGVNADAVVESIRLELFRTWQEPMMPLDRLAVGKIYEAAMASGSAGIAYAESARKIYDYVKRTLGPG